MINRTDRQNQGIEKWKSSGCKGTCLYPTGFGKTRTAFTAISRFITKNPKCQVLVVVPTDYLKDQWFEQVMELKLFDNVTVRVINTVVKSEWKVDFLVLDEIHTMAADTFYQVFNKVKYKIILGLTGTIDRLDGKEELLKIKCPIVDQLTMEEAITNGWLSPYKEYKVMLDVDTEEYDKQNQEFLKYFSFFNFDFTLAMNCVKDYKTRYEYAKRLCQLPTSHPQYHSTVSGLNKEVAASAFSWNRALKARKDFVMNHPYKIEITKKILDARPDSKAITFSSTIKAAEEIGRGYVLHSGKTKKKRGIIKEEFDKLTTGVLNTSKALDCGE